MKQIKLGHREHSQYRKPANVATRNGCLQHRRGSRLSSNRCPARHGSIVLICPSVLHVGCLHATAWDMSSDGGRQLRVLASDAAVASCHRDVGRIRESRPHLVNDEPIRVDDGLRRAALVLVLGRRLVVLRGVGCDCVLLLRLYRGCRGRWLGRQKHRLCLDDDARSGLPRRLGLFQLLELGGLLLFLQKLLLTLFALQTKIFVRTMCTVESKKTATRIKRLPSRLVRRPRAGRHAQEG